MNHSGLCKECGQATNAEDALAETLGKLKEAKAEKERLWEALDDIASSDYHGRMASEIAREALQTKVTT